MQADLNDAGQAHQIRTRKHLELLLVRAPRSGARLSVNAGERVGAEARAGERGARWSARTQAPRTQLPVRSMRFRLRCVGACALACNRSILRAPPVPTTQQAAPAAPVQNREAKRPEHWPYE